MSSGATLALFARLIVSLGVVFGLMWFLARVVRRRGLGGVGSGGQRKRPGMQVDIVARRTLSRNASIAVVRAGNQHMVVGVTDHMITKLSDADMTDLEIEELEGQWTAPSPGPASGPTPSWKAMLDQLRDRTVRS